MSIFSLSCELIGLFELRDLLSKRVFYSNIFVYRILLSRFEKGLATFSLWFGSNILTYKKQQFCNGESKTCSRW